MRKTITEKTTQIIKPVTNFIGYFIFLESFYILFFILYGFHYNKWNSKELTFLDYSLIAILSGFVIQTFNKFNEVIEYLKKDLNNE